MLRRTFAAVLMLLGLAGMAAAAPGYEINPADRTLGNPKAKVVLIEYGAFSCPHCAHFNAEVMPQVKKNYIDTGKVLYVFRLFPLSMEDGIAEKLARCLPPAKYFPMIDRLFASQQKWDPEFGVTDGPRQLGLLGLAAGLTKDQVNRCASDPSDNDRINTVAKEAVDRYHLTGTPTLVVNGMAQPSGGLSYAELSALLDKAARTGR